MYKLILYYRYTLYSYYFLLYFTLMCTQVVAIATLLYSLMTINNTFLRDVLYCLSWLSNNLTINKQYVCGWYSIQFSLLCEQNVCKIWRTRVFSILREDYHSIDRKKCPPELDQALQVFRACSQVQ